MDRSAVVICLTGDAGSLWGEAEAAQANGFFTEVHKVASLDDAVELAISARSFRPTVLVLRGPSEADIERAVTANCPAGLPLWAVLLVGGRSSAEVCIAVDESEWSSPFQTRLILEAARTHRLVSETQIAKGELRSLSRRMGHDLRTPLGSIGLAVEEIREIGTNASEELMAALSAVGASSRELQRALERFLFFANALAEDPCPKEFSMADAWWPALAAFQNTVPPPQTTVEFPDEWPLVLANEHSSTVIWTILLENVLRHVGDTGRVRVGWDELDDRVVFWLCDDGPGIPADKVETLLQPFHLKHRLNSSKGLGLSVARSLVVRDGGSLWHESSSTGGAKFRFSARKPATNNPRGPDTVPH